MAEGLEKQVLDEESFQRRDARELLLRKEPDGRRPKARPQMVHLYVRHERCLPLAERRLPLRNVRGGRR